MPELLSCPPPADLLPALLAIPNAQVEPRMLAIQAGPDGRLGPEGAGAILMLQATFVDADKARCFWERAITLMDLLAEAPGFIRRYSFPDELSITLLALWRTAADAKAFAATPEHRAAVRDLYRERWQYSHFSAIWELSSNHGRVVFCDQCDGITPASEGVCGTCSAPIVDVFKVPT